MKTNRFLFIALLTSVIPLAGKAASFDCNKARLADEHAICNTRHLSDLDVEMSTKYHFLRGLFGMGAASELMDVQSEWLEKRLLCESDVACLTSLYQHRIKQLDQLYEKIDKPI